MQGFLRSRMHIGAGAVLIIVIIFLLQNSLSDSISVGKLAALSAGISYDEELSNRIWNIAKLVVFFPVIVFWVLDKRKLLGASILMSCVLLTLELLSSTLQLVLTLGVDTAAQAYLLIKDTTLVMIINVLIFSLWYWIIDSPRLRHGTSRESEPWDFLFPQRAGSIPRYDAWMPSYADYLFLAFTTTFAFGPTDTLPLSQRSKLLMLLQAAISVTTIVVLAGRALSLPNLD
jgi:hypothetical protein